MEFISLPLPGLILVRPRIAPDNRGHLIKNYSANLFQNNGIEFIPRENFYSVSHLGVIRGMHFQAPPSDYGKLVHCVRGRIQDAALDIRAGSPTYGKFWSGDLDGLRGEALYLPPGFAHGFYSYLAETVVAYSVSHVHDPILDRGIRWDSFGHVWPSSTPIISTRDSGWPSLGEFSTPFLDL